MGEAKRGVGSSSVLMKKSALFPSSPIALRMAAIMHRRSTTAWHEKNEINNFRTLVKHIQEEDLLLVERYYRKNWPPRTGVNHLRHDLATLINRWSGEVDRARSWCEAHPEKPKPRVIIQMPPTPSEPPKPLSPEEQQRTADFCEQMLRRDPENKTWQRQVSALQQQKQAEA